MKHATAKRLLLGGAVAITAAILLGWVASWGVIAPAPVIVLTFVLLIGGALAFFVGLVYYITHPVRRRA